MGGALSVRDEAEPGEGVYDQLGWVVLSGNAVLTAGVVERVCVMPVVPALADGKYGGGDAFRRADLAVIRPIAVLVCNGVDKPGGVQDQEMTCEAEQQHTQPIGVVHQHSINPW